jgi:type IV secretory pathway ATPase VirB11/archaellum biosynthesis ATPase
MAGEDKVEVVTRVVVTIEGSYSPQMAAFGQVSLLCVTCEHVSVVTHWLDSQVIIGPPGSGKTTYCCRMAQFMADQGR